jgi:hypothetical protein
MARNEDDIRNSTVDYRLDAERRERQRDKAHFEEMIRRWRSLTDQGASASS